jgi:hypothetical protein
MPERVAQLHKSYDDWNSQNMAPQWRRSEEADDDSLRVARARRIRAIFEGLDEDHDGSLSQAEFRNAPDSAARRTFREIDTNRDGNLTLDEVETAYSPTGRQSGDEADDDD